MVSVSNVLVVARRRRKTLSWRQASVSTPLLPSNLSDLDKYRDAPTQSYRRKLFASAKFKLALFITVAIILAQLLIANHYLGSSLFARRWPGSTLTKDELLSKHAWLCHSYPHLNQVQHLAQLHNVELVVVDSDLLNVIGLLESDGNDLVQFTEANYKSHQGPSQQKSITHLAAINETSGGQPNLKSFYKALKGEGYAILKYEDASETMPHELYRRLSHQFDDVQADALRDLNHQESRLPSSEMLVRPDFEISKLYTEFISHLFILNSSKPHSSSAGCKTPKPFSKLATEPNGFVVIHIFVLYNYEYEPDTKWIQSSLRLSEIERHKLLTYGVHSVDFKVPLEHYYVQRKRRTALIAQVSPRLAEIKDPFKMLRVFATSEGRLLEYANNTYLHCKPSPFNLTGLIEGQRKMSGYLRLIDSAQPLPPGALKTSLHEQLLVAFQFMNVLSRTYGNFSYWLTGSSLLAYHKFCELVLAPTLLEASQFVSEPADRNFTNETIINLELGLFADELNKSLFQDLSNAKSIGVTMISNWRKPNSHLLFHVKDCPNLTFNLYLYELRSDLHQSYFITRNNLITTNRFEFGRKQKFKEAKEANRKSSTNNGRLVFSTDNLKLCWTRIDRFHPFKVPCNVHDHLRRIYVT